MSDSSDENKSRLPSHIAYSVEEGSNDKNHWHKIAQRGRPRKEDYRFSSMRYPLTEGSRCVPGKNWSA